MLLSSIILSNKIYTNVSHTHRVSNKLESGMCEDDPNTDIKTSLIKNIKDDVNIYRYTNEMFSYIYKYISRYSNMQSPITIINETLLQLTNNKKMKSLVSNKFIK